MATLLFFVLRRVCVLCVFFFGQVCMSKKKAREKIKNMEKVARVVTTEKFGTRLLRKKYSHKPQNIYFNKIC